MRATRICALQPRCCTLAKQGLKFELTNHTGKHALRAPPSSPMPWLATSSRPVLRCSVMGGATKRRASNSTQKSSGKEPSDAHVPDAYDEIKSVTTEKLTRQETLNELSDSIMLTDAEQEIQRCVTVDDFNAAIQFHASTKPSHGHVAYIRSTLVQLDKMQQKPTLETYDALLSVLPQNSHLMNRSLLDAIWPTMSAQSELAMDVLLHMEEGGVIPEASTHALLLRVFGAASGPVLKCRRLVYWMRRFAFVNPYRLEHIPEEPADIAKCLLERIGGPGSDVEVIQRDPDFVFAVHTEKQSQELADICASAMRSSPEGSGLRPTAFQATTLMIDGPFYTWFLGKQQPYYVLAGVKGNAKEDCAEQPFATVDSDAGGADSTVNTMGVNGNANAVMESGVVDDVDASENGTSDSVRSSRTRGLPTGLAYTHVLSTCVVGSTADGTVGGTADGSDSINQSGQDMRSSLDMWIQHLQERHEGFAEVPLIMRANPTTATTNVPSLLDSRRRGSGASSQSQGQWQKRKHTPP